MALEHGFRRIVIALSVALLALGLVLDAWLMLPHATVQVTLKDGREFALERKTVKEYLTDRDSLVRALKNGEGIYRGGHKEPTVAVPPMKRWTVRMKDGIVHHRVLAPNAEEAKRIAEGLPPLDADSLSSDPRAHRAAGVASDLSLDGEHGNRATGGGAAAVSLHDTIGVAKLGSKGPHRRQGAAG